MNNTIWMLPEGIDELLPPRAWALEKLRRKILDHYWRCGYDLVHPPQIEYIESLLVGTGHEFDLQTFKLIDQLNGRTLGVRADMTPQVARIDAHRLNKQCPVRLCYLGTVLRTRPDGFAGGRSPLQLGAEIYGHTGVESDSEILGMMLDTLRLAGLDNTYLDIGHVGIFRSLAAQAQLSEEQTYALFEMLQRKSRAEIEEFVSSIECRQELKNQFKALIELNGDESVLARAENLFADARAEVVEAVRYLRRLSQLVLQRFPGTSLHFDLAELRGYHYHTGVVFAAYQQGQGQEIARGGRYDDIGEAFGRARPATGFSTDLKFLVQKADTVQTGTQLAETIFAPSSAQSDDWQAILQLRAQGRRVVCELPGQIGGAAEMECSLELKKNDREWQIASVE